MKNFLIGLILVSFSVILGSCSYIYADGKIRLISMFFAGIFAGMFIMFLRLSVKNSKINAYKRELEKESISSDESASRVKVLESKIEVLEKALENALKK